jgi:hypothetical protein
MNTFDPSTNLDLRDGGLPAEDRGVDRLLGELGRAERARATPAMLDRVAMGAWAALPTQSQVTAAATGSYKFAARDEVAPGGTTAVKGTPWFTPMRAAAAIAMIGTIAAGVAALRSGASGLKPRDIARAIDSTGPSQAVDATDPDLALIDALWSDTASDDLWADASELGAGGDISIEDLLVGGPTDSAQGGAM